MIIIGSLWSDYKQKEKHRKTKINKHEVRETIKIKKNQRETKRKGET